MSILKWNLSFALHHNLKRTNYLKELQNVWKRCREGLCEWFSSIFTNLFLKMVLRLRTSPTNLIRHWTTGKKGKRGNKVHGDCQSNLVCLSNNFIPSFSPFSTFSPFPLSVLFLPLSTPSPFEGKRPKQLFAHFQLCRIFDPASWAGLILKSYIPSWCRTFSGMLSTNEK